MRNYRIKQNTKDDNYKVEGQYKFLFGLFKGWITYKDVDYCMFGDWYSTDYLTKWWWWLNILFLPLGILLLSLSSVLGVLVIIVGFCTTFFTIMDGIVGDSFKDKNFYDTDYAKDFIQSLEKKEKIKKKVEKEGKSKVVGVYMNGEYIDGERLARMKKLERIVEDE